MSNLVAFKSAGLPSVQSLSSALRVAAEHAVPVGQVLVKMDKTGHWVYGAESDEVEKGSEWAINPFSFAHGYIAWGVGAPLAETMAPMTEPVPEIGQAPAGAERGWQFQVGFNLKCLTGEDAGMDARFASSTLGAKRAVQELALAVANQADKDSLNIVPIVTLEKNFYTHQSYGKVFVPVFKVLRWVSMDGPAAEAETSAEEPAGDAAPQRRRRVAA